MGMFSVQHKVCILTGWALMLMYSAADREPVLQNQTLTWDEARNHCQVCFKDLISLGPTNIQTAARNLTSDHWLGLRKNSSSNSSMPWTRWVNGDPLTFQNWYPGWPVFKSPTPPQNCCSCSCTCPETTTPVTTPVTTPMTTDDFNNTYFTPNGTAFTDWTDFTDSTFGENASDSTYRTMTTAMPMTTAAEPLLATCTRTPMEPPDEPETDQDFLEDSCVAMLSNGAWIERNCTDRLSFICYEDDFLGPVNSINITSKTVSLTWPPGPSGIHHYRVEVRGRGTFTKNDTVETLYELSGLTEGTKYTVEVIPVKCERDLNRQTAIFYTPPNKVEFLEADNVTNTSVVLRWMKPVGNVDFYRIKLNDKIISNNTTTTEKEIGDLTPGNKYEFSVTSGLEDRSRWSKACKITQYTKPGIVTELNVSDNTKNSLLLQWKPPKGNFTGYRVTAKNATVNLNETINVSPNKSEWVVSGLTMGTKISLSVTVVLHPAGEEVLAGDEVTTENYTAPGKISNLSLIPGDGSIKASWNAPNGSFSSFTVDLQLDNNTTTTSGIKVPNKYFQPLKTAAKYTVIVYTISGHIKSKPVNSSVFTLPQPPTDAKAERLDTVWNVRWKAPENVKSVTYRLSLISDFWAHNIQHELIDKTEKNFSDLNSDLKPGSKYHVKVQTVAGDLLSEPSNTSFTTVPDEREVSLSMMCSSEESLLCDSKITRDSVFTQMESHFRRVLKDNIFWKLEKVPVPKE